MTDETEADPLDLTHTTSQSTIGARVFGPYRLLQRLGEGGMGEVWLAEQTRPIQRQVALKVIKAGMDTAQVVARFEAERQALALMDHPAIATVFDGGSTPAGRPYFAMEYVKGEPITAYCNRFRMSVSDRLELFVQVCDGVQHAHQKGVIHRDLKPSNLLVTVLDGKPVVKIIDFGVAKAIIAPLTDRTLFTEFGMMIGTPEYMSPEQADLTSLDIDTRSDVYALGVVLYELLTGTLPFDRQLARADGIDALRRAIRETDPPNPSVRAAIQKGEHASQLRGELDWITMKALEKDRTRRYDSVSAFATDIRRHLQHEPVTAGPSGGVYRARKFVRRHRVAVGVGAAMILVSSAFGVTMAVQAQRLAVERDRANIEAALSKQVSDFLVTLFKVSDPGEARGNSLTAREVLDKGAAEIETALGQQPELHARLQSTIGQVYNGLGLYAKAQALLLKSVATHRRLLGPDHPETLAAIGELANSYWYQAQYPESIPLYAEVAAARKHRLGPDHPDTMRADYDLASAYVGANRMTEAEPLLIGTLERQKRVLGPSHADTLDSLGNLSSIYYREKRFAEAMQMSKQVLEGTESARGANHPETIRSMHNLATNYAALREFDQAEALYLETLKKKKAVLGAEHPDVASTLRALAHLYFGQHRFEAAVPLLLEAHRIYHAAFGDQNARTQSVIKLLVDVYAGWGKKGDAAKWQARVTPEG